ncbi:hypothetical protein [Pseudoprimorskyibacter insulae]|uniref:Uncharacterized protein n=1 Tax=Pseudoprimorskyibacter insulae TaxID=1695997 RepID=A0A2R8AQ07_9RHOB|nr:hypothetical protein [Pseudoprimorskyibacter insulae]SPF78112.1 hypothetical protein PRI8871_00703 [Pseudoprimorskyibacter insulae]
MDAVLDAMHKQDAVRRKRARKSFNSVFGHRGNADGMNAPFLERSGVVGASVAKAPGLGNRYGSKPAETPPPEVFRSRQKMTFAYGLMANSKGTQAALRVCSARNLARRSGMRRTGQFRASHSKPRKHRAELN